MSKAEAYTVRQKEYKAALKSGDPGRKEQAAIEAEKARLAALNALDPDRVFEPVRRFV